MKKRFDESKVVQSAESSGKSKQLLGGKSRYEKQVSKQHYGSQTYDTLERFISYYLQKALVLDLVNKDLDSVLEIGKGSGFLSSYLKDEGFRVDTFDIDKDLKPDFVGDINEIKKVVNRKFSVVCCFEVLEHIKFEDIPDILSQLSLISEKYLLISVPQVKAYISVWIKLSKLKPLSRYMGLAYPRNHVFDGEHYWELGSRGHSESRFRAYFSQCFREKASFTHPLNPYHKFFVLEKKNAHKK